MYWLSGYLHKILPILTDRFNRVTMAWRKWKIILETGSQTTYLFQNTALIQHASSNHNLIWVEGNNFQIYFQIITFNILHHNKSSIGILILIVKVIKFKKKLVQDSIIRVNTMYSVYLMFHILNCDCQFIRYHRLRKNPLF